MSKRLVVILLSVTVFLALFLRFFALGEYPNGFHRDEAFFGYNAYSILKTGKDMSGNFLPLHIASFLYTPSGYSYVSIPFIAIFGLSEFSVRGASALFGSATVLITYFLCLELFAFRKRKDSEVIGLVSAFLLAVSPWHINLSRTASAIAVVVFFIALGLLCYLYGLKKKSWVFLIGSFLLWFVSLGFYIAPYSFLPLFIPLLFFLFRKDIFFQKTKLVQTFLFGFLVLLPLSITLTSSTLSLRANSLSVFKSPTNQILALEQIHADKHVSPLVSRLIHNKAFFIGQTVVTNYFHHLSFDFLFTDSGLPDRYRVPLVGLVYVYELPLLLVGIATLLMWKNTIGYLLIGWVLLAPIGSSLATDDVPNLQRTLFILPGLTFIVAVGLVETIHFFKGLSKKVYIGALGIAICISILFYLHQYYDHASVYRPWYRQDGYKELVAKVDVLQGKYTKVVATNRESAPTVFFLFYNRYNPAAFQKETDRTTMHDFDRIGFGKYEFSQEECPLQEKINQQGMSYSTGAKGVLYVNSGLCKVPKEAQVLGTVYRSDN